MTYRPPTDQELNLRGQLGNVAYLIQFRACQFDYREDQIAGFANIANSTAEAMVHIVAACESTTKEGFEAGMQHAFKVQEERAWATQEGKP